MRKKLVLSIICLLGFYSFVFSNVRDVRVSLSETGYSSTSETARISVKGVCASNAGSSYTFRLTIKKVPSGASYDLVSPVFSLPNVGNNVQYDFDFPMSRLGGQYGRYLIEVAYVNVNSNGSQESISTISKSNYFTYNQMSNLNLQLNPVQLLSPSNGNSLLHSQPVFQWTHVRVGVLSDHYKIEISTDPSFSRLFYVKSGLNSNVFQYPLSALNEYLTKFVVGTTYYWRIKSYDSANRPLGGTNGFSRTFDFTLSDASLPQVNLLYPKNVETLQKIITFSWSAFANETNFYLLSLSSNSEFEDIFWSQVVSSPNTETVVSLHDILLEKSRSNIRELHWKIECFAVDNNKNCSSQSASFRLGNFIGSDLVEYEDIGSTGVSLSITNFFNQNLPDVSFSFVSSNGPVQSSSGFSSVINVTNDEGFARFAIEPGTYSLSVSKDGYQFYSKENVVVRSSSFTNVRVKLLSNFAILSGQVKDRLTQEPIANVVLRFYADTKYYEVFTDSSGFYSTSIGNGTYSLDIYDAIPSRYYHPIHKDSLEIGGGALRNFNFYLERYQSGRIVGLVRKGRSEVPGMSLHATLINSSNVNITLDDTSSTNRNIDAVTNTNGEFFMDNVTLGTFRVFLRPPGVEYSSLSLYKDITVRSGETAQVVFDLDRVAWKVKGIVYDFSTNRPIENAQIWFSDAPSYGIVETDRKGRFSIVGYNGTYNLNVYLPGYGIVEQEVIINERKIKLDKIMLSPVQGDVSFNITYSRSILRDYTVRLEEVNQLGSLIASSPLITRVITPDNYSLPLSVPGNTFYRFSFEFSNSVSGYDIDPIQMFVNSGESNEVSLSLLRDATVSGRVIDVRTGEGLSDVSIIYESTGIRHESANTGGFRFSITEPLAGSDSVFRVSKLGYDSELVRVSSSTLRGLEISLSESASSLSLSSLSRYNSLISDLREDLEPFNNSIREVLGESNDSVCSTESELVLNGSNLYPEFTNSYSSLNLLLDSLRRGEEINLESLMSLRETAQLSLDNSIAELQLEEGKIILKKRDLELFYDSLVDLNSLETLLSKKRDLLIFISNDDSLSEYDRTHLLAVLENDEFGLSYTTNSELRNTYRRAFSNCESAKIAIRGHLDRYGDSFADLLNLLADFAANNALSEADRVLIEVSRLLVQSRENIAVVNRLVSEFVKLYDFIVFQKFSYLQGVMRGILETDLELVEERVNNLLQLVYNVPEKLRSVDTYLFSNLGSLSADMGFVQASGSASFLGEISDLQTRFQLVGSITIENDIIGRHEIPLDLAEPIEIDLLEILPENIRSLFAGDFEMGPFLSSLGLPSITSEFIQNDGTFEIVSLLLSLVPFLQDLAYDANWLDNLIQRESSDLHRFVSISRDNLNNDLTLFSLSSALTLTNAFTNIRSSEEEMKRLMSVTPEDYVESNSVLSFLPGDKNPLGGATNVISEFGFSIDQIVNLASGQLLQVVSGSLTSLFDNFDFDFATMTIPYSAIDSLEAVNGFSNALRDLIPSEFRPYFSENFSLNGYKDSVIAGVNDYLVEFGSQNLATLSQTLNLPSGVDINFEELNLPRFISFITNDNVIKSGLDFFAGDTSTLDEILRSFHSGALFYRFLSEPILLASQIRLPISGFEASLNDLTLGYHRGLESFEISASLEAYFSDLALPDLSMATSVSTSDLPVSFLKEGSVSLLPSDLVDLSSISAIKLSSATPFKLYIGLAGQTLSIQLPQLQANFPGESALRARLMDYDLLIDQINLSLDPNNPFLALSSRFQFDQLEQDIRLDATFGGSNGWGLSSGNVILESPIEGNLGGWNVLLQGGTLDAQGLQMTGSLFLGDVVDRWLDVQGCLQLTPSGEPSISCSLPGFTFDIPSVGEVMVGSVHLGYLNNVRPFCSSGESGKERNSISEDFLQAPQIFLNDIRLGLNFPNIPDINHIDLNAESIRLGVCTDLTYSGLLSAGSSPNIQVKRYEFAIDSLSADLSFALASAHVDILSADISIDTDSSQYLGISNYRFDLDVAMSFSVEPLLEELNTVSGPTIENSAETIESPFVLSSSTLSELGAFSVARTAISISNGSISLSDPLVLRADQGGIELSFSNLGYDQKAGLFSGQGQFMIRGSLLDSLYSSALNSSTLSSFVDLGVTTFSESDDLVVSLDFSSTRSGGIELIASSAVTTSLFGLGTINSLYGQVRYDGSLFSANLDLDIDILLNFNSDFRLPTLSDVLLPGDSLSGNLRLNADFDGASSVLYINNLSLSNKRRNQHIASISNSYLDLSAMSLNLPSIHISQPLENIYYLFNSAAEHRFRSIVASVYTGILTTTIFAAAAAAPFTFGLSYLAVPAVGVMLNYMTLKADMSFGFGSSFAVSVAVCFDGNSCSTVFQKNEPIPENFDPFLYGRITGFFHNSISQESAVVSLYSSETSRIPLAIATVDSNGKYLFFLSKDSTLNKKHLYSRLNAVDMYKKPITKKTSFPLDENIYVEASLNWLNGPRKSARVRLPEITKDRSLDINLLGESRNYEVPLKVVGSNNPAVTISDYQIQVRSTLTEEEWILNAEDSLLGYLGERFSLTVSSLGYISSSFDVTVQEDRSFSIENPFGVEFSNFLPIARGASSEILVELDFEGYTFSASLEPIFPDTTNLRYSSYCSHLSASVTPEFSAIASSTSLLGASNFNLPLPVLGNLEFTSSVSTDSIVLSCENSTLNIQGLPRGEHTLALELPGGSMSTYGLSCPSTSSCTLVGSLDSSYTLSPSLTSVHYSVQVVEEDTFLSIPNITITLSNDDLSLVRKFRTNSQGIASLDLLRSITYNIQVTPEGREAFEYSLSTISTIESSNSGTTTLEVSSGKSVRFEVLSAENRLPIEGVTLSIDGSSLSGLTNSNGYIDFQLKDSLSSAFTTLLGATSFAPKRGYEVVIPSGDSPRVEILLEAVDTACLPSEVALTSVFSFSFSPVAVTCNSDATYTASGVILLPSYLKDTSLNSFVNRELYVTDLSFDRNGDYVGTYFPNNDSRLVNLPHFTIRYENGFQLDFLFKSLGELGVNFELSTILNPSLQKYFGSTAFSIRVSSDANFSYIGSSSLFKQVNQFSNEFLGYSFVEGIGKFYLETGKVLVENAKLRSNLLLSQYINLPRYSESLGTNLPTFESTDQIISFSSNRQLTYRRILFSSNSLRIIDPVYQIGATNIPLSSCTLPIEAQNSIECVGEGQAIHKDFGSLASIDFMDPVIQISSSISELFFRAEVSLKGSSTLTLPMPNLDFTTNLHFILEENASVFSSTLSLPNIPNGIDWAYDNYIDIDLNSLYLNLDANGSFILLSKFDVWSRISSIAYLANSLDNQFSFISREENQFVYSVSSDNVLVLPHLTFPVSVFPGFLMTFDLSVNNWGYRLRVYPAYFNYDFQLPSSMYSPIELSILEYALSQLKISLSELRSSIHKSIEILPSSVNSEITISQISTGLSSVTKNYEGLGSLNVLLNDITLVYSRESGLELRLSTRITSEIPRSFLNEVFPEQLLLDEFNEERVLNLEKDLTYRLSN